MVLSITVGSAQRGAMGTGYAAVWAGCAVPHPLRRASRQVTGPLQCHVPCCSACKVLAPGW